MEIESWHVMAVLTVFICVQPLMRWLRLREKMLDHRFAVRESIVNAASPDAATGALARLEAFETQMRQTQKAQEMALDQEESEPHRESIVVGGRKYTQVLSFEDFR